MLWVPPSPRGYQSELQNASASEELAATSEELSGQAEQLQQSIAFFNRVPARQGIEVF